MKPFLPTTPLWQTIPQLRQWLLLPSAFLALIPTLRADPSWGVTYNAWLHGTADAPGSDSINFDLRKSNDGNPLNGPFGVPQSPLLVQDGTAVSTTAGSSAVASYSLATEPGLYWGHFTTNVGYGTPTANSAGAQIGSFVGGAPMLASSDEFVVTSATLAANSTVTLRATLTLAVAGVINNSPLNNPVTYNIKVSDNFDGNNPISLSFDQTVTSGQATVSFDYSVQVGHTYAFHPQFFFSSYAESNATGNTAAADIGYDLTTAGSAGFFFPGSDAAALTNSGVDYGQNNLPAAYAIAAVPEPAAYASVFGGLSLLGALFYRRPTRRH